MHSWFHLFLLFFSPCFFFILFDPKPMRKQHLDLWTSHMLFQWKRLQGEGRDSKGSNNKTEKRLKATNKLASGPQVRPSLSQMRNLVLIVLSETPGERLHMGIKYPAALAPAVHQRVTRFLERQRYHGGEFEEGKNDLQKHRAIMASDYVHEVVAVTVEWKKLL